MTSKTDLADSDSKESGASWDSTNLSLLTTMRLSNPAASKSTRLKIYKELSCRTTLKDQELNDKRAVSRTMAPPRAKLSLEQATGGGL